MKVAVLQSNYIPWKGYFDIIHDVDLFIFHDDLQYTKNDWRNRNKIQTPNGSRWLTIPTGTNEHRMITEVELKDSKWQKEHYNALYAQYSKAPFFKQYKEFLNYIYFEKSWKYLYELNRYFIIQISYDYLGIATKFADSRDFNAVGAKHEKLLDLVQRAGAATYVSGPAAQNYIIADDYQKADIEIVWKDYAGYPEYPQMYEPFEHQVSILDLLFNTGKDAPYYIWGWREKVNETGQAAKSFQEASL